MASLGTFVLCAAFVVCSYAAAVSVAGARRRSLRLVESGIGAFHLVTALMTVASVVLINAFLTDDFSIKYVAHYSDLIQPLFYKITSYWGGLDGSIMFWVLLLSVCGSIAVHVNRARNRELIPYVVATITLVEMFFLYLMIVHKNPFTTFLTAPPRDGNGLNPQLQNYWMVIHPPALYTGFVSMTIPYAFGMAALITGDLDDAWLRAVRRWTMFSWLFLSVGLGLGMIWAYEMLGWGGFWAWDPVENAALLPWFTATAFLHSVMVQERRGMLRVWNVTLVIVTFFLTIFGTFMTRSGVVESVHAFGLDPTLAWLFTAFMIVLLVVSFGFVIYRLPLLRSRNHFDSWFSRESAFLLNNWILLFSAFFLLFATMFPTLAEAVEGERLTVAAPFYNKWMVPIGLLLLLLTGIGPLMGWRKATLTALRHQIVWPAVSAVATAATLVGLGSRGWASDLCFSLCAFVTATIVQEFWRGANVRRRATGTDLLTALVGLVGRNKRRYGGYIVHLAVVLIMVGFAGQGFKEDHLTTLTPGQQVAIGHFSVRYDSLKVDDDGHKQRLTALVSVFEGTEQIDTLFPARWYWHKHDDEQPTTNVAIRRRPAEDLYIVLVSADPATETVSLQTIINPLVNWLWLGFGVLGIGTIVTLLPDRTFAFAASTLTADALTTTAALVMVLVLGRGVSSSAQQQRMHDAPVPQQPADNPFERQMQKELVCVCGTCPHYPLSECSCADAARMRQQLTEQVRAGKSRDQIREYFVTAYGSEEPLGAPIDKGFNRLAWFVPYAVGAGGVALAGFAAVRLSRRDGDEATGAAGASVPDSAMDERLNDELRDLD